jgi:hypothetical protein
MLGCLAEVERRSLHLEHGGSTFLEYCVERWKWGEGAAMQRIIAARSAALYPGIYSFLRDGLLNLSAVSRLAPFLTIDNHGAVLSRAAGRKRAALDEMIAELRASAARVAAEAEGSAPMSFDLPFAASARMGTPARVDEADSGSREDADAPAPMPPRKAEPSSSSKGAAWLSFRADDVLRRDLERARFLLERRSGAKRIEDVIAYLLRDFLRRRDPDVRKAAREGTRRARPSRCVPQWVRDRVWNRDGGRCAFVAPDGPRCAARRRLEYDHVLPWARGGSSDDPDNIRLLCRAHNLFLARRDFGARVPATRLGAARNV